VGRRPGAAGIARRRRLGWAAGGRRKERGEGEADRRAPVVSAAGEKKKRRREEVGRRGRLDGPLGPSGLKGSRRCFSFFSSFSFSNSIFKPFFISNSNQTFQTFSQEFYKLFRNLTSNKKPCKPTDDAQTLVVSKFIKLYLIF
jgi:hypothetical protein